MRTILPAFERRPEEGKLIGRLTAGYGEVEFSLAMCVAAIIDDRESVMKVLFRGRGETQRITLGDALARHRMDEGLLRTMFETAVADMRHCLKIRNQYAHCNWGDDPDGLWFIALEDAVEGAVPWSQLEAHFHRAHATLLAQQEAFFCYVLDCFMFIQHEVMLAAGRIAKNPFPRPSRIDRPLLRTPDEGPDNQVRG